MRPPTLPEPCWRPLMLKRFMCILAVFISCVMPGISISLASTASASPSVHDILVMLAQNASFSKDACSELSVAMNHAVNDFKMHNYAIAQGSAYAAAQDVAYCQGHGLFAGSETVVGRFLVLSVLSSARIHVVDSSVRTLASYARTIFLAFPSADGAAFISDMKKAGLFGLPRVVAVSHSTNGVMTAIHVVREYNGNSFLFTHNFNNHLMEVTGVVSIVSPDGSGGVDVALDGDPGNSDKGFNDFVDCSLGRSNASEALKVFKEKTITVEGVYDPEVLKQRYGGVIIYPIDLLNCRIVKA